MSTKSLLYVLAQTQNETMAKIKKILDGLEDGNNNNGCIVKIPNSAKLLLKDGEILLSNPLLLLLYSSYFLSSSDCLRIEQNNLTNSMPCEMASSEPFFSTRRLLSTLEHPRRKKGGQNLSCSTWRTRSGLNLSVKNFF